MPIEPIMPSQTLAEPPADDHPSAWAYVAKIRGNTDDISALTPEEKIALWRMSAGRLKTLPTLSSGVFDRASFYTED